jgi:hypothetical protein
MSDADHNVHAQYSNAHQTNIKHERRIEKRLGTMVTNQSVQAEITNFGSVKKVVGPPGWTKTIDTPTSIGTRAGELFHPADDAGVNINVFYRGMPIDDKSANIFSLMLSAHSGSASSRDLTADEIKSLATVMGFSTVGDNQYTNSAPKGSRDYPVFNLTAATLLAVNGRTVLKARGNFQNDKAVPGTDYEGFYFPARGNPTQIEQLFFQAPTRGKFLRFYGDWEKALKTVEWN